MKDGGEWCICPAVPGGYVCEHRWGAWCRKNVADDSHFVCIHCNRLVERATYEQHHCPRLDALREQVSQLCEHWNGPTTVYRQNEKGVPGVFACDEHDDRRDVVTHRIVADIEAQDPGRSRN